ncbi:hypothetical protein AGMMS4952_16290 [Spirochaetia bacterium]|nr:hypothetical protein AGMMS4952_16290 [Spirochaetia bacterium]
MYDVAVMVELLNSGYGVPSPSGDANGGMTAIGVRQFQQGLVFPGERRNMEVAVLGILHAGG